MMNTRVLELIQNPKIITENDLQILESESEKMPYAQSLRAIYLYGIHLYKPELYKENLTKTAAYTTDKKILYQFINSQKFGNQVTEAKQEAENHLTINNFDTEKIIASEMLEQPEFVVVNGEKNRLLYEGEENFLEEKTPEIDLEATKESGQIVLEPETESQMTEEKQEVENLPAEGTDLSFNGIEDFLPEVKFSVPKNHSDYLKPEGENQKPEIIDDLVSDSNSKDNFSESFEELTELENSDDISFGNIQEFKIVSNETKEIKSENISVQNTENQILEIKEKETEESEQNISEWQPMQLSSNIPDALIGKKQESQPTKNQQERTYSTAESDLEITENQEENPEIEIPVFNVSFFGEDVAKIEKKAEPEKVTEPAKESNVRTFINTWQSWLKIDRKENPEVTESEEKKPESKEKIIDDFIEKNPKISQLKEESSFVVKEKKDDISHLMTETLAKLYTEQKLYSKAIKAYEILREKYPEKSDYFREKIEEIKEMRKS